jgi:transposase
MSKGKRYTEEFKTEAVRQVVDRGYPVDEVAGRLGISAKSLYKWRSDLYGTKQQRNQTTDHHAEIVRLKAQLKRVEEERDILKKAARYFASLPE